MRSARLTIKGCQASCQQLNGVFTALPRLLRRKGQSLIGTVEDVELIDPDLSGERLLYRLNAACACSRRCRCARNAPARAMRLKSFAPKDRAEMVKDDKVVVTCEFCSSVYEFTPHEAGVEE
jgi:molecular chaperone Hsp33